MKTTIMAVLAAIPVLLKAQNLDKKPEGQYQFSKWYSNLNIEQFSATNHEESPNSDIQLSGSTSYSGTNDKNLGNSFEVFNSKWLFSMDDEVAGFQSNFFQGMVGYPQVVCSAQDADRIEQLMFTTHADKPGSAYPMGSNYIFSINTEKQIIEPLSMAWQGDDFTDMYEMRTLAFLDNPPRLYRTRLFDPAQILDLNTLEPIEDISHISVRQVDQTGPNGEWLAQQSYYEATATDGSPYWMVLPRVTDMNGDEVFGVFPSDLGGFTLDGGNCGVDYQPANPLDFHDLCHQNGADFSAKDTSWNLFFGVDSWRNARVDTVINGQVRPIGFGLVFYVIDRTNNRVHFLKDLSRDINFQLDLMTQHHPKFVNNEFDANGNNWLTLWHNNREECSGELGEAITIKFTWVDSLSFEYEFGKKSIGPSYALGSNYVKIFNGDTLGLGNTSYYDADRPINQQFQGVLYETEAFMPAQSIAAVNIYNHRVGSDESSPLTYQIDFTEKRNFSTIPTNISWQLSEDSSQVTVQVDETPTGNWYWNGSDVPTDSVLSFPVDYILQKQDAWFYISGNYPSDVVQYDWINRMLSANPVNLKDELETTLNLRVGVSDLTNEDGFELFPNPSADGRFELFHPNGQSLGTVSVVNSVGQLLFSGYTIDNRLTIDLNRGYTVARTATTANGIVVMVN